MSGHHQPPRPPLSLSLPQLSLLTADGEKRCVEEDQSYITDGNADIISPLTPKLAPTFRAQNLSPFWFNGASTSPQLSQISGATSNSPFEPSGPVSRTASFSMLHAAAITGNTDGLAKLASGNFCDIDLRDKFGRTPLMYAVLGNFPECVEILIKNKSDATLVDSSCRNALHWAVHHGYLGCVKILLNKCKIDWKAADQGGVTVLHLAMRNNKNILQLLLKKYNITKDNVDLGDINKRTALHWACSQGNYDQARIITKIGADIGMIDVEGKTPMHWAASSKSEDSAKLIRLLVNLKPKSTSATVINWQDYEGRQPLHLAVMDNTQEVVSSILSSSSCMINALDHRLRSALHWAALAGKREIVAMLLDHGAKYDLIDESGATPVHLATQSGSKDAVEVFVERNLSEQLDQESRTPLMWAAASGFDDLIAIFKNVDLNKRDKLGYTTLHIAVSNNIPSIVKLLLSFGADSTLKTNEGFSPILLASYLGHEEIVRIILKKTGSMNQQDLSQRNCLHLACQSGHLSVVQLLLKSGARISRTDVFGRTALIMASFGGYLDVINVLLDAGDVIDHQDNEGMCSLHWAVRKGHLDAVKLLLEKGAYPNNIGRLTLDEDDEVQLTPLDTAIMGEMSDMMTIIIENKGITIARIYNIAATRIQAYYRGYKIRTSFNQRKKLIVRHLELRAKKKKDRGDRKSKKKEKEKKRTTENKSLKENIDKQDKKSKSNKNENTETDQKISTMPHSPRSRIHKVAGKFLGSVVEEHQRSSYLRRVQPGQDEPLPENKRKMSRSKSVITVFGASDPAAAGAGNKRTSSASQATEKDLNLLPLSSFLEGKSGSGKRRPESRFSYNLKS